MEAANTFEFYIEQFERISREEQKFSLHNYLKPIRELSQAENLKNFLKSIIASQNILLDISCTSYLHQNGFQKFFLYMSKEFGWRIRLHIWEPNNLVKSSDIHNHAWDYISVILIGGITNEIYEHCLENFHSPYFHYEYQINDKTAKSSLSYSGQKYLCLSEHSRSYIKGETYCQSSEVMHKVIPLPNELTATLVFQQKPWRKITDVYKNISVHTPERIGVLGKKNTPAEVENSLLQIIKRL